MMLPMRVSDFRHVASFRNYSAWNVKFWPNSALFDPPCGD